MPCPPKREKILSFLPVPVTTVTPARAAKTAGSRCEAHPHTMTGAEGLNLKRRATA